MCTIDKVAIDTLDDIKYEKRIIAFIDILGFTNAVRNAKIGSTEYDDIVRILGYFNAWNNTGIPAKNTFDTSVIGKLLNMQQINLTSYEMRDIVCTAISDSVIVSILYEQNRFHKIFSTLISDLSFISSLVLKMGFLIRGGIAFGNLAHKKNGLLFGPAYLDALELEKPHAKNARIILSPELVSEIKFPFKKKTQYPYQQFIVCFDDGYVGFNQMQYFETMQVKSIMKNCIYKNSLKKELSIVREKIVTGLNNNLDNIDVFAKYKWMAKQYNKININKKIKENIFCIP